jgi:protein arginine N-methyltransferase 3
MCKEFQPDEWSDSEDEGAAAKDPTLRIRALEEKLALVKQDFADYRSLISQKLNVPALLDAVIDQDSDHPPVKTRDDDTHYFESYGENGLWIRINTARLSFPHQISTLS